MSRERILEVVLTMLGAVLLLIAAVGKHPYGFYMVLRLVITVGAVYWAWRVYKAGQRAWTWIFVAVALLLNPFLPIRMQRAQWQPIDLCLGIFLIGWSGYWLFRKRIQRARAANLTGEVSPAPRQRLETLSLQLEEVNKKLEERQEKRAWEEAQRAVDLIKEEVAREERKAGRKRTQPDLNAEFDVHVEDLDKLLSGARAASPRRTSPARGWWTDSTLYSVAWTAVCLLWGGWFSLAVSAPDTVLGVIIVFAMAFGGFAWAEMDWSLGINKVLAKVGIKTFSKRAAATVCLISLTILALNFVGSLAARSSTPETQLITDVSGTSVASASAGCHPPMFSQQELSALEQQAANGNAEAQCGLGRMYMKGQGAPQDYTQAALWFRKAAEQGNVLAQYDLGVLYNNGQGVLQDYAQAALWFRKAAEQGDTDAQNNLGGLYDDGQGVPQDYAQAALWFRKAAEQGNADAQYNLGVWYEEGKNQGAPQDDTQVAFWRRGIRAWRAYINSVDFHNSQHWRYTQAALWYRKAAEQGDTDAQYALGHLYDSDFQDYEQAAFWYRKAADQGNSNAEYMLGNLYLDGDGVPQDATEAAAWYRKAAEQSDTEAQESLGRLYENGQGLPKDYAEAYFWLDLAAAGKQDATDSKQVAKDRDEAASHLTPADLSRVQERARKWFEEHQAKPQ